MSADLSRCPSAGQLRQLLDEQLSGPDRDTVETHVESCHSCQEHLERLIPPPHTPRPAAGTAGQGAPEPDEDFLSRLRSLSPPQAPPAAQPPDPPRPGPPSGLVGGRLGRYEILGKLGRGGMGDVYRARHVELGKEVALKVLPAELVDELSVARFKQEVRAVGRLDHPNVVTAHDAGEDRGVHFLVMALVDGIDLGRLAERLGPLPVPDACELARQAALALQHISDHGLVHRDVKPSNLMLARDGLVKLLDLGLARSRGAATAAQTLTARGIVLGTADYLAPEQWQHAHAADIRADIYGLGCTLFHLLAGRPPFGTAGTGELFRVMRAHLETPAPPVGQFRPGVPDALAAVVARMLAKDPADRYATPAEVAEALRPFAEGADLARLLEAGGSGGPPRAPVADTPGPAQAMWETRPQPGRAGPPGRPSVAGRRRYGLPLAGAAVCLVLVGIALVLRRGAWLPPTPPTPPAPPPEPLAIEELRVSQFRGERGQPLGDVRVTAGEIRVGDDVRVFAKLSAPAYCYLIAFNPDGTEQLCHPAWEGDGADRARAVRPEKVTEVRFFPSETDYFGLDSAGLQVFVLAASSEPLPPYAQWRARAGTIPWRAVGDGGDWRWEFDGEKFTRLPLDRGKRRERGGVPPPLRELCDFFKARADLGAVRVIAFPVTTDDPVKRLHGQVWDLCREGKYAEAQAAVRDIIAIHTREKGADHFETGDAKRSLETLERIAALPDAARAEFTETYRLQDEVNALVQKGAYPDALPPAKRILEIHRRHLGKDHSAAAVAANQYATLLHHASRYAEAEPLFREALEICRRVVGEDHPATAKVRGNLAINLEAQSKYAEAGPLYEAALKVTRLVHGEDHPGTAVAMNNLATHLDRQGFHDRAEGLHRKALDILLRAEGGAAPSVADARNNLAYNLNAQGKHAAAEELYRQVLDARRKSPGEDHPDTAMSYGNLANCLDEQGRHAEAEHLHNKALDIYRRRFGEEHAFTAIATNNLAMNLQHQRRYEEAEPLFRKALEIHLRTAGGGPSRSAADVHNNLAANLQARGEYDAARAELEKSLAMLRELLGEDHPQVAQLYSNTAALLDAEGKHAEAESLVRRALGALEKRLGREHPQTVQAYANLANNLHNQERYAEAEPLLKEALEMHRRLLGEGHPGTAWAYLNRVSNLWAQGKYREAEELGPAAAASFEAARPPLSFGGLDRAGRTAELSPLLTYLAAAAAHNGSRTAAWGYLERRLGRGLLDEVSAPPLSDAERERERTLLREISRLDRQVEALLGGHRVTDEDRKEAETARRERDAAQAKLVALRAEMAAKYGVAAGKVYDLPGIQKRLPPDAALVTWVHIPGEPAFKDPSGAHWACAVRSRGEPVWVRLPGSGPGGAWGPDDDELPARVRGLLAGRADVAKGEWKAQAAKLRAQRLAPVEPHLGAAGGLPEVRHLIVLPSNRMAGVPLEVLADRFTVSYAPSGTMFAWLRERRGRGGEAAETPTTLLALGDPDFRRSGTAADASRVAPKQAAEWFAPLPATRRELQAISRLFDRSELLLGSEASEQNLSRMAASGELRKFRFLHFATHGVLDDRRALRSALVLAQDRLPDPLGQVLGGREAYDGRLTAEEVLRDWKLGAELVTLSACDTGLGKYSGGEGYIGFSQALFLSGARGMVVSLWPVDELATALLMGRFYENMLGTPEGDVAPLPKAEALAEAKRWLRGLTAADLERLTADLPRGLPNGTRGLRRERATPDPSGAPRPFAHPYYWSAFILVGDPS